MNNEKIEVISKGILEDDNLIEEEKEIALKILKDLEGTLVIRATSILKFCLKAIQYSKIKKSKVTSKEVPI
ncbi:hypothetical protein [Clostridium septicum]|uniref:Uncharacterized protein n=1 Tax=Clostridium septicum TaxID=1504 RepID=A0A9N7PMU9_CLOSE|nr:hypothetical protein [Clostridium septicum]AYE35672.1 hypothetical protein CP523_15220 [Clostridium septicum]UEC19657.1 hypothetical protein LK444_09495 [Clostridium septicum]USS02282.1 hypothetical protein NH397_07680 [Clostridium septicum]WLF70865.1 hypothetical protein Q6375_07785 [Clostridium septicum]